MAYLGKTPSQAVRSRYYFTATGGETSLSGTDDNSNTLTFTDGNYVDVMLNGATLVAGTDYNTTTANTIAGLAALAASDVVEIVVYDTFSVFGGNMAADLNFKDNVKANFGTGNDLQIYHDVSNSYIKDAGTGDLIVQGTQIKLQDASGNDYLRGFTGGAVYLHHAGNTKFETTATGVDVTGTVTADERITIDPATSNAYGADSTLSSYSTTNGVYLNGHASGWLRLNGDGSNASYLQINGASTATGPNRVYLKTNNIERFRVENTGDISFYDDTGTTQGLFWDASTERLGVGTTSPAAPVDIAITSNQGLLIDATAGNNAYLTITNGGSNTGAKIGFDNGANATVIGHHTVGNILYANSSGKVGIGTGSPSYKTEISDGTVTFGVNPLSAYSTAYVGTTTNHGMNFITNSNSRLNITSGGNVGIGVTNPTYQLQLASTDPRIAIRNDNAGTWFTSVGWAVANSNDYSIVQAGVAERLRIDSNGSVGIGTGPSGAKLHVAGGLKATDLIAHDTTGINLQTSNGTKRLIVDNSGRVTMPYQPAFEVRNSGNVNLPTGTEAKTIFTTVRNNRGSHYSTSTGRFTAPVTGTYLFTHCGSIYSTSSNPYLTAIFKKNGTVCSSYGRGNLYGGTTVYGSAPVTAIVDMNANDYVELWCYSGATGANFYNGEANFSGCLLG